MSRWIEREEEKPDGGSMMDGLSRSGAKKRPRVSAENDVVPGFGENRKERILYRDREYEIRPSSFEAMNNLGRFRMIYVDDLIKGQYGKEVSLAEADLRALKRQGLVRKISFHGTDHKLKSVYTLTQFGHGLVSEKSSDLQLYYFGFSKPAEIEHDALFYRAYGKESSRIRSQGGTVKRIVLDYELKRELYSRLNKPENRYQQTRVRAELATELHLPIVDGHVVFPDVRLEFENERGENSRADIEVATGNYREKHMAVKAAAGFRVYAEVGAAGGFWIDKGPKLAGGTFRVERSVVYSL